MMVLIHLRQYLFKQQTCGDFSQVQLVPLIITLGALLISQDWGVGMTIHQKLDGLDEGAAPPLTVDG